MKNSGLVPCAQGGICRAFSVQGAATYPQLTGVSRHPLGHPDIGSTPIKLSFREIMMKVAVLLRFAPLAFAAALLFAPGVARAQADAEGIVVYNAQHASLTEEWVKGFTK